MSTHPLQFKVATEEWEFEQVHELNYRTFVEEIPQHRPSSTPRLVDKFHAENTYLVCLRGNQVVGMIAAHGRRPFSLDQKLPNLDSYLPPGRRTCEIRLLSVEKEFRNGQVFRGLTALMWQFGRSMATIWASFPARPGSRALPPSGVCAVRPAGRQREGDVPADVPDLGEI